jgi:hypothetical protein
VGWHHPRRTPPPARPPNGLAEPAVPPRATTRSRCKSAVVAAASFTNADPNRAVTRLADHVGSVARVTIGWIFLEALLDEALGGSLSRPTDHAWLD